MQKDVAGFVGNLDKLVPELIQDPIYSSGRLHKNSKAKDAYEDAKKLFKKLKKKFDGIDMLKPLAEL